MNTSISTFSDSRQMPNIRNLGRAIGSGRSALGLLPLLVAVLAVFLSGELCTARRGPGGRAHQDVLDGATSQRYQARQRGWRQYQALVTGASSASGLSLDGSKLYWTQTSGGLIKRANLDGNSIETLVGGLTFPFGVLLEPSGKM